VKLSTVVEARNLVLEGKGRVLLSHFHLELHAGLCTVVLGPKGSGKSILLKAMAGIYPVSAGELYIEGINLRENTYKAKQRVGYIPEEKLLDPAFSAMDNLYIFSRLHGITPRNTKDLIKQQLRVYQLEEMGNYDVSKLSECERERFLFIRSLVNDPRFILYDQPVDDTERDKQWARQFISRCKQEKRGVLVATDNLDFAQSIADYIIVLNDGKCIFEGEPKSLVSEHVGKEIVEFLIKPEDVDYYINKIKGRHSYQLIDNRLKIYVKAGQDSMSALQLAVSDDINLRKVNLRDVYDWSLTNKDKEYASN
tara:strand:- start:95912 stop:96841 length:930 start_codon:yes stop_codon:yes gene_type:complete